MELDDMHQCGENVYASDGFHRDGVCPGDGRRVEDTCGDPEPYDYEMVILEPGAWKKYLRDRERAAAGRHVWP